MVKTTNLQNIEADLFFASNRSYNTGGYAEKERVDAVRLKIRFGQKLTPADWNLIKEIRLWADIERAGLASSARNGGAR